MKTTVEIPDTLYRQIKAHAAMRGQTVKAFLLEALQQKLATANSSPQQPTGWRSVFGKANAKEVNAMQGELDEEFSRVNQDEWQ